MKALSPTGSPIIATLEMIPGCAEVNSFTRAADGSLDPEYGGYTDVLWDAQRPAQRGGVNESGPALFAALQWLVDEIGDPASPKRPSVEAIRSAEDALATAKAPGRDLYVDENGEEWTEAELTLVDDDAEIAPPPADEPEYKGGVPRA